MALRKSFFGSFLVGAVFASALAVSPVAATDFLPQSPTDSHSYTDEHDDFVIPPAGTAKLASAATGATGKRSSSTPQGAVYRYDVVFYSLNIGSITSAATEQNAQSHVAALDAFYNNATGGMYRFRYAGFNTKTIAGPHTCNTDLAALEAKSGASDKPAPVSGSVGVIPVTATGALSCGYSGLGWMGTGGVHINGFARYVDQSERSVLAHEVGHNLGLAHASGIKCPRGSENQSGTFLLGDDCNYYSYRGQHSVMGNTGAGNSQLGKLAGHQLAYLGVVPDSYVDEVSEESETISLKPLYSGNGTRIITIPDAGTALKNDFTDSRTWQLEYRPAVGDEADLATKNTFEGFIYPAAGAGVVVRQLFEVYGPQWYESVELHVTRDIDGVTTKGTYSAVTAGAHITLPDGTTVHVNSATDSEANITITRTPDVFAPSGSGTLPASAPYEGENLFAEISHARDSRGVCNMRLLVDGQIVAQRACEEGGTYLLWKASLGNHNVTLDLIDAAGNRNVLATSSYNIQPKPTQPGSPPDTGYDQPPVSEGNPGGPSYSSAQLSLEKANRKGSKVTVVVRGYDIKQSAPVTLLVKKQKKNKKWKKWSAVSTVVWNGKKAKFVFRTKMNLKIRATSGSLKTSILRLS